MAVTVHPSPAVRASISRDGLVLLDLRGDRLFAANPIGARIWRSLEAGSPLESIAGELAHDYGIPIDRARVDVARFVASLAARGLVDESRP